MSFITGYEWQVGIILVSVIVVLALLYTDKIKALLRPRGSISRDVKRDWLTTARLNVKVPPGAIDNPNTCYEFPLQVQETQTVEDVSGTLHTVPRFRNPTLYECRVIMGWWNEMLQEHPERLAPADPSQHIHASLRGMPDHQLARMKEEAKRKPLIISRPTNPEPKLPEGMTIVPDQTT